MADSAKPLTPSWIPEALNSLLLHYRDAMRLEYIYKEHFLKNIDQYVERIGSHVLYKDKTGGGVIDTEEKVIAALGPMKFDGDKFTGGSNWLEKQTSWRMFGLITGYNMQFQRGSILEKRADMIKDNGETKSEKEYAEDVLAAKYKWYELWNWGNDASTPKSKIISELRLRGESARFFTGAPGTAEPGGGYNSIVKEGHERSFLKPFADKAPDKVGKTAKANARALGGAGTFQMKKVWRHRKWVDIKAMATDECNLFWTPNPRFVDNLHYQHNLEVKINLPTGQQKKVPPKSLGITGRNAGVHPMSPATALMLGNSSAPFYSAAGRSRSPWGPYLGHFLSPELAYYFEADGSKLRGFGGTLNYTFLMSARDHLVSKGRDIIAGGMASFGQLMPDMNGGQTANGTRWKKADRLGTSAYESFLGEATHRYNNPELAKCAYHRDPVPGKTRKYSKGHAKFTYDTPDRLAIFPTLPLESLFLGIGKRGASSGQESRMTDASNPNYMRDAMPIWTEDEAIAETWKDLYEEFKAGTGPIAALGKKIEGLILGGQDYTKLILGDPDKEVDIAEEDREAAAQKSLKAGELDARIAEVIARGQTPAAEEGDESTEEERATAAVLEQQIYFSGKNRWQQNVEKEIERLLDFFGVGFLQIDTEAQARGKGDPDDPDSAVSGGGDTGLDTGTNEARKTITNYRSLTPFDLQCFLMENIGAITRYQDTEDKTYNNLIKLRGDPGATISQLQHGNKTEAVREILNLTPAVYAIMVPYIKIYRVNYAKDDKAGLKPLSQEEMPIPNFMDSRDVSAITSGDFGRARGWGLQSFTWKLDGVQPAEVDNNISANLSFYFQSVIDLFEGSRAFNKVTGETTYAAGRFRPAPLDLLISSATLQTIKGEKKRAKPIEKEGLSCPAFSLDDQVNVGSEGRYFRIKVVAGWATPPRNALTKLMPKKTSAQLDQLERAISSTRIALYLQQVRHNLTFNQDGSVKLSIDYQAALTGILTSNKLDILGPSTKEHATQLEKLNEEKDRESKRSEEAVANIKEAFGEGEASKEQLKAEADKHRTELKRILEAKKKLINEDKVKKYKRFLKGLYRPSVRNPKTGRMEPAPVDAAGTATAANQTRIYTAVVDAVEVVKTPLHKITDVSERQKRIAKRLDKGNPGYNLVNNVGSAGSNTDLLGAIMNQTSGGGQLDAKGVKATEDSLENDYKANLMRDGNKILISYFYLGDLIDSIIEDNASLGNNGELAKMLHNPYITFLADVEVVDPLKLFYADNVENLVCTDTIDDAELIAQMKSKGLIVEGGVKLKINIGSIPIGLDQFNIWFKNHVIKSQRNTYYLMHFLKDLCAYLIGPSLKKACYETNVINDIRFDTSIVNFNNKKSKSKLKIQPGTLKQYTVGDLAQAIGETSPQNDIPSPGMSRKQKQMMDSTSGLVLYSTDARPKNRHGNYEEDLKDGIYHHYLGSSAGLVKKINFRREDQAYLREAKIQKYGTLGAQQLRELYSATVDMVGNTLFKNGQYTFIWPTSMVANDKVMAKLLGLGGYFLITGVSHKISPSGYDVNVTALQEGLAFDEQSTPTVAKVTKPEESPETEDGTNPAASTEPPAEEEAGAAAAASQDQGAGTNAAAENPPKSAAEQAAAYTARKAEKAEEAAAEAKAAQLAALQEVEAAHLRAANERLSASRDRADRQLARAMAAASSDTMSRTYAERDAEAQWQAAQEAAEAAFYAQGYTTEQMN